LTKIHEFIVYFEQNNIDLEVKNQSDEMSIKIIKILINEIVSLKGESIIPIYKQSLMNHINPDKHLLRWITIILKNHNPNFKDEFAPPTLNNLNNYGSNIINSGSDSSNKLITLIRVINNQYKESNIISPDLINELVTILINEEIDLNKLIFDPKILNKITPTYIAKLNNHKFQNLTNKINSKEYNSKEYNKENNKLTSHNITPEKILNKSNDYNNYKSKSDIKDIKSNTINTINNLDELIAYKKRIQEKFKHSNTNNNNSVIVESSDLRKSIVNILFNFRLNQNHQFHQKGKITPNLLLDLVYLQ